MGALGRVTGFWESLTGPSRRLLIGAVVIFIVGIFMLMKLSGSDSYTTLATTSSAADASAITKQLDTLGVRYKLTNGGSTIQVPTSVADKTRIDLAATGVLDGSGIVGNEIFDKSNLGATDFTNRINLVRAQEGELSRTIGHLDPVQAASVKIAMPQEQLFTDQQQPTTAAVSLTMKPGEQLDSSQVEGITRLVAMSVPGLKADSVIITDSQGNILQGATAGASGVGAANDRLAMEATYERGLQSRLDAMLAATLGPGMAVTQVHAALNLDKVTTDSETFDKKNAVPLEADVSKETLKSTGGSSGAVTGASANTPAGATFPATASGTGKTDYKKNTGTTRYGVNHVRSQIEQTPGAVVNQSVSVQISDQVPAAALQNIQASVEAAVGFDKTRGDVVNVATGVPFSKDGTAVTAAAAAKAAAKTGASAPAGGLDIISMAKTAAALIGLLMFAMFARKSLRRRQSDLEKALPELLKRGPVPISELTGGGGGGVRQLEGQRKSAIESQMEDLAKRKPDDVAQLLRGWLLEGR